jgi:hypothetical protein
MPDAIIYLDRLGQLRLGGGITSVQIDALIAGQGRAVAQLELAASLVVNGNTLKVINHTEHKLISGYPEGRRMWLNLKWYNTAGKRFDIAGRAVCSGRPIFFVTFGPPARFESRFR